MTWVTHLAYKYLPLRKKKQSVQWMGRISFWSIAIITSCALIIQSVMNGLTGLVLDLYNALEPDVIIESNHKKYFTLKEFPPGLYAQLQEFGAVSFVIEKKVLLKNYDKPLYVKAMFVEPGYFGSILPDSLIERNRPAISENFLILGKGLADAMGVGTFSDFQSLTVMAPTHNEPVFGAEEEDFFNQITCPVTGNFSLNEELDFSRVYLSQMYARKLFEDSLPVGVFHVKLKNSLRNDAVDSLKLLLGTEWKVIKKDETHRTLIQTLRTEKEITTLLLWFILGIGLFTVIGSLTLLIIDKKKDIFIINSLGGPLNHIKRIFIYNGIFITLSGGIMGMVIGLLVCYIQQRYHLVPFGEDFIIPYYPVEISSYDILRTLLAIGILSAMAGWYPAAYFINKMELRYSNNKK